MDNSTLAVIFQEGGRLITALLRNKDLFLNPPSTEETPSPGEIKEAPDTLSEKASSIPGGCVPCSIGHLGTCTGLLNEAMRFARQDGILSGEVIDRVNMCLDELNALERVDLRPEMIHNLPEWEKALAEQALTLSRSLRHDLEGLSDISELEEISSNTQTKRKEIGRTWYTKRISLLTPEQRKNVEEQLKERAAATIEKDDI